MELKGITGKMGEGAEIDQAFYRGQKYGISRVPTIQRIMLSGTPIRTKSPNL